LVIGIIGATCPAADESDLASLRQRYEQSAMELVAAEGDQQKLAADQYLAFLDQAREQLKKKYDIEGYEALKKEQERYARDKTVRTDVGPGVHPEVAAARNRYAATIAGAKQRREERFSALTSRYIEALDLLKKRRMDSDMMTEAKAVHDEMERVRNLVRSASGSESSENASMTSTTATSVAVCPVCGGTGKRLVRCTQCSGGGMCPACQGRGERPGGFKKAGEDGLLPCLRCKRSGKCVACSGTGKSESACGVCGGAGKIDGSNVVPSSANSRLP